MSCWKKVVLLNLINLSNMEKIINQYKTYLPIFLLLLYILGYVNLSYYYSVFNVSIEYYINLTDILMYVAGRLVSILLTFILFELIVSLPTIYIIEKRRNNVIKNKLLESKKSKEVNSRYKNIYSRDKFDGSYSLLSMVILFLIFIVVFVILKIVASWSVYLIAIIFFKLYLALSDKKNKDNQVFEIFKYSIIIIPLISIFLGLGFLESKEILEGKNSKEITFLENNKNFSTKSDSLLFIGETSEYLFLYYPRDKETKIFSKSTITDFKIYNKHFTKEESERIVKEWEEKIKNFSIF